MAVIANAQTPAGALIDRTTHKRGVIIAAALLTWRGVLIRQMRHIGALFPVVVKDLTQGTGHFNVSLGALSTVFGLGAALSNGLAGLVVQSAGYSAAFLTLAAVAGAAFVLLLLAMPETLHCKTPASDATQRLATRCAPNSR